MTEPPNAPANDMASCAFGTDITRATLPAGSSTSIDSDWGSTSSVESSREGIRPATRPYVFPFAPSESATIVNVCKPASNRMTRRPIGSFTYTRPSESARMLLTRPSFSVAVAVTVPSCRMGGRSRPLLCAPAPLDASAAASVTDSHLTGSLIAGYHGKGTGNLGLGTRDIGTRDIGTSELGRDAITREEIPRGRGFLPSPESRSPVSSH